MRRHAGIVQGQRNLDHVALDHDELFVLLPEAADPILQLVPLRRRPLGLDQRSRGWRLTKSRTFS